MNENITIKQGYQAMLHLLNYYWETTGSNDLTDILSGGEFLEDGKPADSAFGEYWEEAIQKVKDGSQPFQKELK